MAAAQACRQVRVPKANPHILITGASAGIGKALCEKLAERSTISAIARRKDQLDVLSNNAPSLHPYSADVSDRQKLAAAISRAQDEHGDIDIAILNAGMYQPVTAEHFDAAVFHQHMAVNYMGVIYCLEAILPQMIKRRRGHIAIMASVAGYRGLPRSAAYGPSKAALQNLAESLYFDLTPKQIKVQLINPGFVETQATSVNDFTMPGLITAERAADEVIKGLQQDKFEIAFPRGFTTFMKCASILPYNLYLSFASRFMKTG